MGKTENCQKAVGASPCGIKALKDFVGALPADLDKGKKRLNEQMSTPSPNAKQRFGKFEPQYPRGIQTIAFVSVLLVADNFK